MKKNLSSLEAPCRRPQGCFIGAGLWSKAQALAVHHSEVVTISFFVTFFGLP